ncbi:hypothetical protein TVAG_480880 [Trichomonas vaginalis G3]|uniref:Uncharacterized protein n=1 Tax=Trichomonas vaginalis (strain ATCC PRA-98 / G3) TaxID=412133 RepID=A2F8N4_TRIV3|nr:A-type inclusion protein-related family [Trichomonas vaginalis G3]EAX98712.1 hypothetical protein TVAG_480880 [Trichomonas vaginalis G3]KAI5538507.1 A-type inclusion protein-related family [Trichomonas vaginalis G3]|eukprot:XP_001311642.1 hypothetical protein [Trichomonas vaginalis G3]
MEDQSRSTSSGARSVSAAEDYSYSFDAVCRAELENLYDLLSKRFSAQISTIQDADKIIQSFVNEFYNIKKQLDVTLKDCQEMQGRLANHDISQENEIALLKRKLKRVKAYKEEIEKKNSELDAENKQLKEQIKTTQEKSDSDQLKIARIESQLECMKNMLEATSNGPQSSQFSDNFQLLEELIANQSVEITSLLQQRDRLVNSVNNFNKLVAEYETQISTIKQANISLEQYKKSASEQISTTSQVLPTLAHEIDQMLPDEVRDSLVCDNNTTPHDFITSAFEALVNSKKEEKEVKVVKQIPRVTDEKYLTILSRLEDAMCFIAGNDSTSKDPLTLDDSQKTKIFSFVQRISKFIDEQMFSMNGQELSKSESIFEPKTFAEAESRFKEFLSTASKEELEDAPLRELFVLFNGVCEVNNYLVAKNQEMKDTVQSAEGLKLHNQELARLNAENYNLRVNLQDKEKMISEINESIPKDMKDVKSLVESLTKEKENTIQLNNQNKELVKQLETLQNEKEVALKANKKVYQEFEKKISEIKNDNQQKQETEAEEALKKANECLMQQLDKIKSDGAKGLKAAVKKMKKLQSEVNQLQQTIEQIHGENEQLKDENVKLEQKSDDFRQNLESQNEFIATQTKELQKLKETKDLLKEKIKSLNDSHEKESQKLKDENYQKLNELRKSLSTLQNNYEIEKAKSELTEKTLAKLTEQKNVLVEQNTKLRISERSLKLKISQMNEAENLQKASSQARELSIKSSLENECNKQIADIKSSIEAPKKHLKQILEEIFEVKIENEDVSLEELVSELNKKLLTVEASISSMKDVNLLRRKLRLEKDQKISDIFSGLEQKISELNGEINDMKTENSKLQEEMKSKQGLLNEMKSKLSSLFDWNSWARAAYMQIVAGSVPRVSDKEIRESLDDILFANISKRTEVMKRDLLREEKKILKKVQISCLESPAVDADSVRPMIVSLVFVRRIRRLANENRFLKSE